MTALSLPALDGRSPLGFLAALGVLRLVTEYTDHPARLAWSPMDGTAVLHDAQPDVDSLVADLTDIVRSIPDDGVLPGASHGRRGRRRFSSVSLAQHLKRAQRHEHDESAEQKACWNIMRRAPSQIRPDHRGSPEEQTG